MALYCMHTDKSYVFSQTPIVRCSGIFPSFYNPYDTGNSAVKLSYRSWLFSAGKLTSNVGTGYRHVFILWVVFVFKFYVVLTYPSKKQHRTSLSSDSEFQFSPPFPVLVSPLPEKLSHPDRWNTIFIKTLLENSWMVATVLFLCKEAQAWLLAASCLSVCGGAEGFICVLLDACGYLVNRRTSWLRDHGLGV